jgi:leader peptidase (prepilin peptidase) / N-methyltransferase
MVLPADVAIVLAAVLGLLVGSFLNVVIHRLPRMLEAEWAEQCAELAGKATAEAAPFNLMRPGSRCPQCGHRIRWYENIPVVSYLVLRAKCSNCGAPIGLRYPLIEVLTAALFGFIAARHGLTPVAAAWAVFGCILIAQFFIDFDTQLLPDDLNYPLLWLGLIVAGLGWTAVPLKSALWGVVFGYLSLWVIYQVHHALTGKEGMGHGDFKLLAALGAWFGVEFLVAIVLLSSVVGALLGIVLIIVGRLANRDIPIPFGPFLAGAGMLAMVAGSGSLERAIPFAFPFSQTLR